MTKSIFSVRIVFPVVLTVAVVGLLTAVLRQRSELERTRAEYEELLRESRTGEGLGAGPAPVAVASTELAVPADPAATPAGTSSVVAVEAEGGQELRVESADFGIDWESMGTMFGPSQASGLELAGTHVAPAEGGLRATLKFFPTQENPPGMVAVVVRLPQAGDGRILDLTPAGEMQFSGVRKRVTEDGKFAVWVGKAESAATLEMALTVSGEAVADVRGTAGIGTFDLEIGSLEAVVRPK